MKLKYFSWLMGKNILALNADYKNVEINSSGKIAHM